MGRTYWHLGDERRVPSRYDVVSTRLLYGAEHGYAVATPVAGWLRKQSSTSALAFDGWQVFTDPRQTTYASYVALQAEQEVYASGVLAAADASNEDERLSPGWLDTANSVVPTLRYPCHALHMVAAYCGQAAPDSKIVAALAFQAADEMRRVQKLAYRTVQLRQRRSTFGDDSKDRWQDASPWQPLRRALERLLTTYDFCEAWVACNLVVKPAFDTLFVDYLAALARRSGDALTAQLLLGLQRDCTWHRVWASSLCREIVRTSEADRDLVRGWRDHWWSMTREWVWAVSEYFGTDETERYQVNEGVQRATADCWLDAELDLRTDAQTEQPR